jgi:hypothetical protein
VGGRIGLHGHGLRDRWVLGPLAAGEQPRERVIPIRRYQCQRCHAVVVVCPREVRRGMRYSTIAIAVALVRWSVQGQAAHQVRAEVSPMTHVGSDGHRDWRSVRRWARSASRLWPATGAVPTGPPRSMAESVVHRLAACAPLMTGVVVTDAVAGALRA